MHLSAAVLLDGWFGGPYAVTTAAIGFSVWALVFLIVARLSYFRLASRSSERPSPSTVALAGLEAQGQPERSNLAAFILSVGLALVATTGGCLLLAW